jgi:uncharacterized protein YdaU (DUF1376 family)
VFVVGAQLMHYYEHHIGDYDKATSHLSAVEDGIYCRLIRRYYDTEQPLPLDIKALQRLVRARARDEKEAVETILNEFFDQCADGWHNKRCDSDISKYQEKQRKARASANARWNKTHGEGNAESNKSQCDEHANASQTYNERNALLAPSTKHHNQEPEPRGSGVNLTTERNSPTVGKIYTAKHTLPLDFGISPAIELWAKAKGYAADLPEYLEVFRLKAEANGYEKTNWESAFKTSMLEDWGKVRERKKSSVSAGKTALQLIEEAEANRA